MFAISTAWNYRNESNIKEILTQIRQAGFSAIEIGYNFTPDRLEELISLLPAFDIKIVSIHSFCPLPPKPQFKRHLSDYYRISSLDEEERKKAVEYIKRTIDTAKKVSAEAVIIHAGKVELDENYGSRLIQLFNENKSNSRDYNDLKEEFFRLRKTRSSPYLEAVIKSLKEILPYALENNIKIGLEPRYYPEEIPNFEEIKYLLENFENKGLYYWHDVGHAEVNERLGIMLHSAFLQEFSKYMIGIHLHDIRGLEDHFAPFSGDFDFSKIFPFLSNRIIRVLEVHPKVSTTQIKEALDKLSVRGTFGTVTI
jgi:sugar phosphate isomerase/epimerase